MRSTCFGLLAPLNLLTVILLPIVVSYAFQVAPPLAVPASRPRLCIPSQRRRAVQPRMSGNTMDLATVREKWAVFPKTWSNVEGLVLTPVRENLWAAERPFVWNSIDVGGKMAVIKLSDGSLWVHSPIELDEKTKEAMDSLGPVKHIVSPNYEHVKYAKQWIDAYPDATAYGCPGAKDKFPEIPFDAEVGGEAPSG